MDDVCPAHSGVCERTNNIMAEISSLLGRCERHWDSGHVRAEHLTNLRTDVDAMTQAVKELLQEVRHVSARMDHHEAETQIERASISRMDKLFLALLATLAPIAAAAVGYWAK